MRRSATLLIGASALALLLAGPWAPTASWATAASRGAGAAAAPEFVFASGLDHGPVGASSPGMHQTDGPGTSLEWQRRVHRTGTGAYHAVGGDLQGDETIGNQASSLPLGGLEVWAGGAFKFVSFPDSAEAVWLIATVPTDGEAGADNKPVVTIGEGGRLRLSGTNTSDVFAEASEALVEGRWYSLVLHGRNGVGQTQQLFVYNGRTDRLIERLDLVLDVTGSFVNRLTKWGFGTSQDSSGLEYYLDDIFHARGGTNPGPVRVFSRAATGAQGAGFEVVGAPTWEEAVDDHAPDGDASYLEGSGDGDAVFRLDALPRGARGHRVYVVQVTAVGRSGSQDPVTTQVGVRVGSHRYVDAVTMRESYAPHVLMWAENPSTGTAWRVRDGFSGVVEDAAGTADGLRLTAIWWDVVFAPR